MTVDDIWTVKAALEWTVGYLERKGDENPRLSAEWLLSEATGMRRVELYVNFERPLSTEERGILRDYVARRGKGEPLQYITGEVAFRHIAVKVRPGVLIPRPETEVLVSEALALLPPVERRCALDSRLTEAEAAAIALLQAAPPADGVSDAAPNTISAALGRGRDAFAGKNVSREIFAEDTNAPDVLGEKVSADEGVKDGVGVAMVGDIDAAERAAGLAASVNAAESDAAARATREGGLLVADICTGSGCIACSIAYERPDVRVIATDIAPEAVALASENAAALGLAERVAVREGDLGSCVPARLAGAFDLVVSNPPYVPTDVLAGIPREVADFEPALALDGGRDGLDVFRRLLAWCEDALAPGGGFAFELHETCLEAAAEEARSAGFRDVRITNDLAGRPRVLTGRRPGD